MKRSAFTLIELLVVIAIIAILAAILFPVFAQAKESAKKAAEISNNKQLTLGAIQYETDNDDYFMLSSWNNTYDTSLPTLDSTYLDEAYPYIKNRQIFQDPMDPAPVGQREYPGPGQGLTDPSTLTGTLQQEVSLFNWSMTADWGVNYEYMGPTIINSSGQVVPTAISSTSVVRPGDTYLALSSLWNRTAAGTPFGGGNAGVDPPCVFDSSGNDTRPFVAGSLGYYWYGGWNPSTPLAWNVFGGVWPWYNSGKTVVISYNDGHVKTLDITRVANGCNVLDGWGGEITDETQYNWATTF